MYLKGGVHDLVRVGSPVTAQLDGAESLLIEVNGRVPIADYEIG
jgi:hypothetical protein